MANSPTQGRPADFKNLSPFAGSKKGKETAGQGFLILGVLGILAAIALVFVALLLKAPSA